MLAKTLTHWQGLLLEAATGTCTGSHAWTPAATCNAVAVGAALFRCFSGGGEAQHGWVWASGGSLVTSGK
eukprot:12937887-Prorocentrum_lima.AAC.1